jgi:RND family efflux transporter MFP subunit
MKTLLAGAALLVLALASAACSHATATASVATTDDPQTVAVVKIDRGDVSQVLTMAAEFRAYQEIDVHAKVAGYLKSILVDVGDRVKTGQLLGVLEIPELQDEIHENEAAVKRADQEISRAEADLRRAESAHEVAHLGASRLAGVLKARPNLIAQQDIDEATSRDRVAEAQVATAQAALAAARDQLDLARASESHTRTLYGYTQITAPFDGVITRRYADTGAMIQAGTSSQTQSMAIVKLSQNAKLRLVIPVPESAVARVHLGAAVDLQVDALHKSYTGVVKRFADRLDTDTRTMPVEVDVDNPRLELLPGMFATTSLVLDRAAGVVVAPIESLDRSGTKAEVLIVNSDSQLEERPIVTGLETADRVEVKNGLQAGDLVVLGNRSQLKAGTRVVAKVTDNTITTASKDEAR